MTARRVAALVLVAVAAGFVWIAALTPLRSAQIAELDAEAQRIGEQWQESADGLLDPDEESARLVEESNRFYEEARALEPPLEPLAALGGALLALAGGIALWPPHPPHPPHRPHRPHSGRTDEGLPESAPEETSPAER